MSVAFRACRLQTRWTSLYPKSAQSFAALSTRPSRPTVARTHAFPFRRLFHQSSLVRQQHEAVADRHDESHEAPSSAEASQGQIHDFQELADAGLVSKKVISNITDRMKITTMTDVQRLTINEAITGRDVLAQAKTGTGKTLAFLLPVLRNILAEDSSLESRQPPSRSSYQSRSQDVRAIIISPTRELAEQIAVEAEKLTRDTGVVVQRAVGGTQKSFHTRKLRQEGCHILVGTPGRLHDLLTDEESGVGAPKLSAFVLDEADRLMDDGFWPEIQRIQDALPSRSTRDRQVLMFSATMPKDIIKLVRGVMKPDLHLVRTVSDNEQPTHERVPQNLVAVSGLENQLPALLELCERQTKSAEAGDAPPFKAIVYFQATAEVVLASSVLFRARRAAMAGEPSSLTESTRIFEIHGRLSQAARTKAADGFRKCKSGILVSTDVTARGLDFPGVTHVIQVGLPQGRDVYVHRLGRTARAGAQGEGWLFIPSTALNEARQLLGPLPMKRDRSLETSTVTFPTPTGDPQDVQEPEMSEKAASYFSQVRTAALAAPHEQKSDVYLAGLGSFAFLSDRARVVDMLNRLARVQWDMATPPSIPPSLASRLRLLGIPGVNLRASSRSEDEGRGRPLAGRSRERPPRGRSSFSNDRAGMSRGRTSYSDDRAGSFRGRSPYSDDRAGSSRGRSSFSDDREPPRSRPSSSFDDRRGSRPSHSSRSAPFERRNY